MQFCSSSVYSPSALFSFPNILPFFKKESNRKHPVFRKFFENYQFFYQFFRF